MALMKLAAKQGMELTVTVDGADEEKAAAELQAFLSANL
jgi:phosphocarrier protein